MTICGTRFFNQTFARLHDPDIKTLIYASDLARLAGGLERSAVTNRDQSPGRTMDDCNNGTKIDAATQRVFRPFAMRTTGLIADWPRTEEDGRPADAAFLEHCIQDDQQKLT